MRFGICVMANIDEIGFFPHAEQLGYDSVWVADSQMLFSDCYAVLALAAERTSRLRIGPGTAICGTRIPPVHAAAMATLNRLAPGRVFLGIGTGNTAMRSMGQRPMKIADYGEYLRVLSALLRGEVVEYTFNGVTRPIGVRGHDDTCGPDGRAHLLTHVPPSMFSCRRPVVMGGRGKCNRMRNHSRRPPCGGCRSTGQEPPRGLIPVKPGDPPTP